MLASVLVAAPNGGDVWSQPLAQYGLAGLCIAMCLYAITWLVKNDRRKDIEHKAEMAAKEAQVAAKDAEISAMHEAMLEMAEKTIPALTAATATLGEATKQLARNER